MDSEVNDVSVLDLLTLVADNIKLLILVPITVSLRAALRLK